MTKVEMFNAIKGLVADNAEMVEFIDHEIELVEKRNARKSTGLTKTQKENVEIKARIVDALKESDGLTATAVAETVGISLAKATALLTQLVKANEIERVKNGKAVTFNA